MKRLSNLRNTLIIIVVTVVVILGSQVYRTATNYQVNKQQFINDVQTALDLSVEKYYADRARSHFSVMAFTTGDTTVRQSFSSYSISVDSMTIESSVFSDSSGERQNNGFSYAWSSNSSVHIDSIPGARTRVTRMHTSTDSNQRLPLSITDITQLTQKIIVSTSEDRINVDELDAVLRQELARKNLDIAYQIEFSPQGGNSKPSEYGLTTFSKSTYLSREESLKLHFEDAPLLILKKGIWDLLLSVAIVFSVIGALLYLYRVIKSQKELAMVKDDLIGNVTHEFKTPIATVTSALEGIANFNETNDPEKTRRYVEMSRDQLAKLNVMVEKLMETATLDSGELEINAVETDVTELARQVMKSFQVRAGDKILSSEIPEDSILSMVDPFHWENVLSNLVDNAIKYGGNRITLTVKEQGKKVIFQVLDDGGGIEKVYRSKIFEKLYRIPMGNRHDIKGFGIGLYYTKTIVERHGGEIRLDVDPGRTCFTVIL